MDGTIKRNGCCQAYKNEDDFDYSWHESMTCDINHEKNYESSYPKNYLQSQTGETVDTYYTEYKVREVG